MDLRRVIVLHSMCLVAQPLTPQVKHSNALVTLYSHLSLPISVLSFYIRPVHRKEKYSIMAPQVKKAKTAFLYFQGDQLSSIRKELNLSMGDAMTEVSR